MITRKAQWLLSILHLRVIINEKFLFSVPQHQPLLLSVPEAIHSFVITNGFHISPSLQVDCPPGTVRRLIISCRVEDHHLVSGLLSSLFCFVAGIIGGWLLFQVLCFVPALLLIYFYYFRRAHFLVAHMLPVV